MHIAPTPPDDFEPWEIQAIEQIVTRFFGTRAVPPSVDADDLVQEAFIHWSRQRRRYASSAGATRRTFLDRVVTRRLISIQREWLATKRGNRDQPLSLDRSFGQAPEGEPGGGLLDSIVSYGKHDPDLAVDLRHALTKLSDRQRLVFSGLAQGLDIAAIARLIGKSRDTVNEDHRRIREVLTDAGLRDYLS